MNVRDEDPTLAEFGDRVRAMGCTVTLHHYAHHDGREIGRIKPDPAHWVSVSLEFYAIALQYTRGKKL